MTDILTTIALNALEDLKANNITQLNVNGLSDVTDQLIIASGTSHRHVKSLATNLVIQAKKEGYEVIGIEGIETSDWVLVDFGDTVIHVMLPETRNLYDLEGLWTTIDPPDQIK